jgi:hypothetical protein
MANATASPHRMRTPADPQLATWDAAGVAANVKAGIHLAAATAPMISARRSMRGSFA